MCQKYAIENEITYNATKTVYMYIRSKHMNSIGPIKQFLYGHQLCLVEHKNLGCYITSDFIDDIYLKRQARAIYSRRNMSVHKFSNCSLDVKKHFFSLYIGYLYCSAVWLNYSTVTFKMTKVAYNNVYNTLTGITRGYSHSISREFCTNNIDRFEAVLN